MRRKRALGFTLIEFALVIVLISIFMGLGLSALDVLQTNRAFAETREKQEKIGDALSTYLSNNQRLPCPDTNPVALAVSTGLENRVTPPPNPNAACSNSAGTAQAIPAIGVLPYRDLGLSRDDALDGWDNFFTYQVSLEIGFRPENEDWSVTPALGSITGNLGSIQINTRDGAPPIGVIAVIISHGPNGLGAYTTKGTQNSPPLAGTMADEFDNTDTNSSFFRRQFTDVAGAAGGTFDDVVRDFTTVDLLTPVIKDGALESAMAQVREQLRTVRDTAFGQVPDLTPCVPPANVPALVDPWGQTIIYGPATAPPVPLIGNSPPGLTHAFCVWSFGPNGVDNSGPLVPPNCPAIQPDDVGLAPVTYGDLRTAYAPIICP